ncbi:MAG TPA: carboxypeptidase-like regulatory domain-containing protein [Thermoanaerobaculia bacterium]
MAHWNRLTGLLSVLLALIPSGAASAADGAQSEVTLRLQVKGAPSQLEASGVANWFGQGQVEPVHFTLSTKEPSLLKLRPGRWELSAGAPGHWGNPVALELTEKPATVTLDLWPAGFIEGGFIEDSRVEPPQEMVAFFRPAPGGAGSDLPQPAKVNCPVDKGLWKCTVPAGTLDIRFQAAGFVPRYLWGLQVTPGETTRPGRLELRQGSSVLGWVVTADRSPLKPGTMVSLRPRVSGDVRDQVERQRLASLRFEATINPKGFFQIDGIPAGAYIVEVRHEGFAPATASVRVLPGEVTEVTNPPLLLDSPKVLEVFVDPPVGPGDQPWTLKLQRFDGDSSRVTTEAEGAVQPGGLWKKEGVAPGRYLLRINHQGNTWWMDEVRVEQSPVLVQVNLEAVKVKGTVHLGKKPLAAALLFGGRWGAVRIEARSDERGRFEALLPRAGAWSVGVSSSEPAVEREFSKIIVEPKPQTDTAEVHLKLPNTLLRGVVRREGGEPAAKAIVTVMNQGEVWEGPVQVWADEEGRFEMRGLLPGQIVLEADVGQDIFAEPVTMDLREDVEDQSVILFARPQMKLSGMVVSSIGPVAGARVKAAPAGLPYSTIGTVTSNAEGRFELRLPPKTQEILLSVGAPGFAFRMLRIPVPESRTLNLGLEQLAGTLVIERTVPIDFGDINSGTLYLLRGGSIEPLTTLLSWAALSGAPRDETRFIIPGLEPGDYKVCWATPSERTALEYGLIPPGACASGSVQANGELTLKAPEVREQ